MIPRVLLFFIPSILNAVTVLKSDHLIPCEPALSDAYASVEEWHAIRTQVTKHFDSYPIVGFYGIPAFVGPYAFQIQRTRESFVIVGNEVASSFTEIMHGNRAHGRQLKREIDPMIAGRVHTIWKTFLSECRFPTAEDVDGEGMDGAEYYFTARTEFGGASGTTWSPDKSRNPRLYLLVSLADAVFAHLKDDSIDTTEIESLLTQLEKSN